MAGMTSPHPEEVVLDQKHQQQSPLLPKMASLIDEQPAVSNGVNGHPSPAATPPESQAQSDQPEVTSKMATDSDKIGEKADEKTSEKANPTEESAATRTNEDAFTSNKSLEEEPSTTKDTDGAVTKDSKAAEDSTEATKKEDSGLEKNESEGKADAANASIGDAPKEETAQPKAPSEDAESAKEPKESKPAEKETEPKPVDEPAPSQDVDMTDAQPSPSADDTKTTQNTETSEEPAGMSKLAINGSQEQPSSSAPATADTSMTDAPAPSQSSSTKIAREREEDEIQEPSAKRARTSGEGAEPPEAHPVDEMQLDLPSEPFPPRERPLGKPGTLGDEAMERKPISSFANREIRKVLGSVKKTKAGAQFKDPVSKLWPHLWDSYVKRIKRPVDISQMERSLRENSYATLGDFVNDVFLVYENAITYNGSGHDIVIQAKSLIEYIFTRLVDIPADEPPRPEKKDPKHLPTRHPEPRAATQPRRESRGAGTAVPPADEIVESPVYAVPASGVPIIRRDSTKNDSDRPKRPIHPPKNRDPGYEPKNSKKRKQPEFRFCDEVLRELMKPKHWDANQWFMKPVDPVADGVPDYHKVIKKPMDLGTMQEKLALGEYNSTKEFENDVQLIIKNCRKYNAGPVVVAAAGRLETLFNQKWVEKDEWLAAHAPPPAPAASVSSPSGVAKDESEDEAEASEPEVEEEAAPTTSDTLEALNSRLAEENKRLDMLVNAKMPDMTIIATQQTVVNMIQKQLVEEKVRLAQLAIEKKPKKASKPKSSSKSKKAAGGAATPAGSKKASGAGGSGKKAVAGSSKKSTKGRFMGVAEKDVITQGINGLDGPMLEQAIDIIKKDTHQEESESGELELDIDMLSQAALAKLYDLIIRQFPQLKPKSEKSKPAPAPAASPPPHHLHKAGKAKKHKPMGKAEQEASIEKLREIKAQFHRPGSGSQEPLPSVEGNQAARDESDDESADSEED